MFKMEGGVMYEDDFDEFLAHFGVKGMRWGVRKEKSPAELDLGKIPLESKNVLTTKLKNGGELNVIEKGYEDHNAWTKFMIRNFKSSRESLEKYHEFTLTDKNGSKVGQASFTESNDGKSLYLEWLGVNKNSRRQGYARASMQGVIKYAQDRGIERLEMEATEMAAPLYESLGFQKKKGSQDAVKLGNMGIAGEYVLNVPPKTNVSHTVLDVKHISDYIVQEIDNSSELNESEGYVNYGEVERLDSIEHDDMDEFLAHFGVKGMYWGVRKERDDTDIFLQKGIEIHNISDKTPRDISNMVYGSHTQKDILNYRANLAASRKMGDTPVFENVFTAKKDIRAPSEKKAYEAFKKIYENDPETLLRDLARARKDMYISAAFAARILKMDRDEVYYQRLAKKGEDWVNKKGLEEFTKSFGTEAGRTSKAKNDYFAELTKKGFNAILDTNDTKNYGSEQPLLIFKGSTTLKKKVAVELSTDDIQNALNAYYARKPQKGGS